MLNILKHKALIFGVLYAVFDEAHQLLIPGRTGSLIDVSYDTLGVILGIALFVFLYQWFVRRAVYDK